MKTLMDHLMEESGKHRKFRYLPNACSNSLFKLGTLASESFSKRMISATNLLVDYHRLYFDHDKINKMAVL